MPEYLGPGEPLVLSGRFVHGGLWKTTLLPRQRQPYWRLGLVGGIGSTELIFPQGFRPCTAEAPRRSRSRADHGMAGAPS